MIKENHSKGSLRKSKGKAGMEGGSGPEAEVENEGTRIRVGQTWMENINKGLGIFLDEPWRRMARERSDILRALRGLSLKPQSPACSWASSQILWHLCDRGSLLKHALGATHGIVLES